MKVTAISVQTHNDNRVNISIDGKYRFSLDIFQLTALSIKIGNDYNESEIIKFEGESSFGKAYGRALEYCLMRPHSSHEIKDYLYRKTKSTLDKNGKIKPGITTEIAARVFDRLLEKGYIDDTKFANYWVENRLLTKGASRRKLFSELRVKGVDNTIIERALVNTERNDIDEVKKIITKKRSRYSDDSKLTMYLARQGFSYDTVKQALADEF